MNIAQNALTVLQGAAERGRAPQGVGGFPQQSPPQNALSFRDALAQSESGGDYGAVNTLGYTGRYQFGEDRLTDYNRATGRSLTLADIRDNPALQDEIFNWHISDIDRAINSRGLADRGFSMNQLRSVAHLGGIGGMTNFVESGGEYNPADAYGTRLSDYATRFR